MATLANGGGLGMDATAAKLLNFAEPIDVNLLDATVTAFYGAGTNEQVRTVASTLLAASSLPVVVSS
jgi:hypothetical protein